MISKPLELVFHFEVGSQIYDRLRLNNASFLRDQHSARHTVPLLPPGVLRRPSPVQLYKNRRVRHLFVWLYVNKVLFFLLRSNPAFPFK